jgi:hypothetical protein
MSITPSRLSCSQEAGEIAALALVGMNEMGHHGSKAVLDCWSTLAASRPVPAFAGIIRGPGDLRSRRRRFLWFQESEPAHRQ